MRLTGYEHRLDGVRDRVLMPIMIDLTLDELTIAGAIDKVLDLWLGSSVAGRREQFQPVLRQLIPTLVYLCSEVPDLRLMAAPATKKQEAKVEASPAQVWELGWRVGTALLAWRSARERDTTGGVGPGVRPHVRRGHPHTYWRGPKDGSPRHTVLRWVFPIRVNMDQLDDPGVAQVVPVQPKPRRGPSTGGDVRGS